MCLPHPILWEEVSMNKLSLRTTGNQASESGLDPAGWLRCCPLAIAGTGPGRPFLRSAGAFHM